MKSPRMEFLKELLLTGNGPFEDRRAAAKAMGRMRIAARGARLAERLGRFEVDL